MTERPVGMPDVGAYVVAEADCLDGVLGAVSRVTIAVRPTEHPDATS